MLFIIFIDGKKCCCFISLLIDCFIFFPQISPYPKPDLPIGPANKASDNYYCHRDARRSVTPDQEVVIKQISDGNAGITSASNKAPTPGRTFKWD